MEQWREPSRSDQLYFMSSCFFIFLIERKCFRSKTSWLCACCFFWLMVVVMMMGASSLASSCVWERMVVYKGTCMTTMVWAAECYFQDLEMIGFYLICFWEQGGFLIHIHNHSLIGPFFWMAKVAVYTNTPAPLLWSLCPLPCPTVPGYHATQPVARPAIETLAFYLCCPTL